MYVCLSSFKDFLKWAHFWCIYYTKCLLMLSYITALHYFTCVHWIRSAYILYILNTKSFTPATQITSNSGALGMEDTRVVNALA